MILFSKANLNRNIELVTRPTCESSSPAKRVKSEVEPLSWPVKCKGMPEGDCQAYVSDPKEFLSHMMEHWSQSTICPVCGEQKAVKRSPEGKLLVSRSNFKVHLEYHIGDRPFKCNQVSQL